MYGKHFASMYTGSMVGSGTLAFALWGFCIANHDQEGFIELNPVLLATIFGDVKVKEIETQIEAFCQPDKMSRSKTDEGRRLEKLGPFLYKMINYEKYQGIVDAARRREQFKEASKRYREKKKKT